MSNSLQVKSIVFLNINDLSEVQLCMSSNSWTWECPHNIKDGADHVPLIFLSSVHSTVAMYMYSYILYMCTCICMANNQNKITMVCMRTKIVCWEKVGWGDGLSAPALWILRRHLIQETCSVHGMNVIVHLYVGYMRALYANVQIPAVI